MFFIGRHKQSLVLRLLCKNKRRTFVVSKIYMFMKAVYMIMLSVALLASCKAKEETLVDTRKLVPGLWTSAYGGVDKSYDTTLLAMRERIAPLFKVMTYEDKVVGKTMTYNLYIPQNYDPARSYPLVLFMGDASTTGKGAASPLKQGYGGIIWATPESQAKHPCFVLVPAFAGPENVTNDQWQVTDEVDQVRHLLGHIADTYNIDRKRMYTTGQSMGGMISFYLNAHYPDLFAASIYVGSQWDVSVLKPLAAQKFFYIVSAADPKASVGMQQLGELLKTEGVAFGTTTFSALLSEKQKEDRIRWLLKERRAINFVQFAPNTVVPQGVTHKGGEHMYSFDYAYLLEGVRDWLFEQTK